MRIRSIHIPGLAAALWLTTLFIAGFSSCTKEDPIEPMEQVKRYLTGSGNRFWRIKELYNNGAPVTLTSVQMEYNKTYTTLSTNPENTGTFANSDGDRGTWVLNNVNHITETIENNPSGPVKLDMTIKDIGPYKLDLEYTANGQTIRTVFFAY